MNADDFEDFYEMLQVSPNATDDTIDRVFRYLAQRYHPDNQDSGNVEHFRNLIKAHDVLRDPEKRAQYDCAHRLATQSRWQLKEELSVGDHFENDLIVQRRVLAVLYHKRRRDVNKPGLGYLTLCDLLDLPAEQLDFHIWYLREKSWLMRTEDGLLAITVDGVDQMQEHHNAKHDIHRLTHDRPPEQADSEAGSMIS